LGREKETKKGLEEKRRELRDPNMAVSTYIAGAER
jgi:hypothetical protein